MGRWSHLDTDEERLPEGMTRVGYDADTQIYTYRDSDGSHWEGAPGSQYGKLHRVSQAEAPPLPSVHISDDIEGDEQPYVLHDPFADDDDDHDSEKTYGEKTPSLAEPRRAKVNYTSLHSASHQRAGHRLPSSLSEDEDDARLSGDDEKHKVQVKEKEHTNKAGDLGNRRVRDRQGQEPPLRPLGRSGTLSRIARYFSRGSEGSTPSGAGTDKDSRLSRASTLRDTSSARSRQGATTGRRRATTFDEILDGRPGL